MNVQEFAELAAGHALHALSPDDERAYRNALAEHPEWESIAMADAATAAALAETTLLVTPPAALRARLLGRIVVTPQGGSEGLPVAPVAPAGAEASTVEPDGARDATPSEPPADTATIQAISRRSWTRGIFALAASMVLLVALGFGAATIGQQLNRPASVVALSQINNASDARNATVAVGTAGTVTAYWSDSLGKAVLVSEGMPSIPSNQSYELWFVRNGTPVSAGVMAAGPKGDGSAVLAGQMHQGDVIAVTVEQAGGSPTGKPTTPAVVTIPTA